MQAQANWESQLLALAGHAPHPSPRPFFSYWAGDAVLQKAYRQAAEITKAHSKSFYAASGLLPEEKRSAARALYAFCRTVDDVVDEVESKKDRDFELDYWREIVQTASASTDDLVAAAWADTLTRYHIPRHYALQLIDALLQPLQLLLCQLLQGVCVVARRPVEQLGHFRQAHFFPIDIGIRAQIAGILENRRISHVHVVPLVALKTSESSMRFQGHGTTLRGGGERGSLC